MTHAAKIINLPKILDKRGNLSFIEEKRHVPFEIHRTYWIYDVPGGEVRGGHAYRENEELVIALSGSFDVVLHDGKQEQRFSLNRSYYGLLSSTTYDSKDYIRDFDQFIIEGCR